MKIKLINLGVSMMLIMLSCAHEEPAMTLSEKQEISSNVFKIEDSEVKMPILVTFGKFQMLKFNTWQEFDVMAKYLAQQQDVVENNFYNQHYQTGMSDDTYNSIVEEVSFSNETPLQNFENALQFNNSYRKIYNAELQQWLSNDILDDNKYPKNKTLFSGAEFSLINDRQQIMIGNVVYQCTKEGYLNVTNDYENALNKIEIAVINNIELQTLGWWFINPPQQCVLWKKTGVTDVFDNGNYKTIRSCGIRSFTIYAKTLAELESYKKRNNGGWRKYRRDLRVHLVASVRDFDCNPSKDDWEVKDKKNRSELEANRTFWTVNASDNGGDSYRAELGSSIWGGFSYANRYFEHIL